MSNIVTKISVVPDGQYVLDDNGAFVGAWDYDQAIAEIARLRDGLEAVRQYGYDTLTGPTKNIDDTREWQRDGVLEMTNRAARTLRGDPWVASTREG